MPPLLGGAAGSGGGPRGSALTLRMCGTESFAAGPGAPRPGARGAARDGGCVSAGVAFASAGGTGDTPAVTTGTRMAGRVARGGADRAGGEPGASGLEAASAVADGCGSGPAGSAVMTRPCGNADFDGLPGPSAAGGAPEAS